MNTHTTFNAYALLVALTISSCKKDDGNVLTPPPPTNEVELITTVELHFHSSGGAEHKHFHFTDLDGDGGNAPVIEADTLSADSIYGVEIHVRNESANPSVDITSEIQAESALHRFFFQFTSANASAAYDDADPNGHPIGLETTWTIGAASVGTVMVILRHEPDKGAAGVSAGDIANAGGETDIQITFPVVIEQ